MALIFTPGSEIHLYVDCASKCMALYDFYQGKGEKDIYVVGSDVKNVYIPYSFYDILKKYPRKNPSGDDNIILADTSDKEYLSKTDFKTGS